MRQLLLFLLGLMCFTTALSAQSIVLNEIVASNTLLEDEDGDTPDWFELYNPTAEPLSLNGWTVSDDPAEPDQWTFPNMVLPAGGYLQVWASDKDRRNPGIPRTLIQQGDVFRYRLGSMGIPADWHAPGFDDSNWAEGATGIGYGDGDDQTTVPTGTRSVYLRRTFTVADPSLISDLILDVDYDDAFVAYLNGMEIARANIEGTPPAVDAPAITDREARMYSGGRPERTVLPDAAVLLQAGTNVLSIEVHNISEFSSDMSLIAFLSARYSSVTSEGSEPPALLELTTSLPHTNFKVSADGETLYLYDQEGMLADSLGFERLLSDVSCGRIGEELRFFTSPTPGAANGPGGFAGIITSEIEFSHPGGAVDPLVLSLSGTAEGEVIHYTLDATEPTAESPVYAEPISIDETTVVRARIFRDGYLPVPSESRSYLLGVAHDLPILALVTEPNNFFHPDTGMYVLGQDYQGDEVPYFGSNIWEDWERPVHLSLYEPDGSFGVAFNAGAKIFGGWSRANDQRSLSIFARNRYGIGEIDYPLFPSRSYDTYQAIVLRNSGNDWLRTMLRDGALTSLMEGSGLDIQAYRPVATYLNGQYWGMYNMREKINEHFLASRHGVDPDALDRLEFNGDVIQGSNAAYWELIDFVSNNSLTSTANYNYVRAQIDIKNFIIYQIAEIYFGNTDWPGNNLKYWKAPGGKWRWILFDTDFGFGIWDPSAYSHNTLAFALESNGPGWPNPPWSTLLFRRLVENLEFRNAFVNQFADEMNSRFVPLRVLEHIDSLAAAIASEMPAHFTRWGADAGVWQTYINQMRTYGNSRRYHVKQAILHEFNLPAYRPLTIEIEDTAEGYVQVNSLTIDENLWVGDYFEQVPVRVTALARPGYAFSHWTGSSTAETAELEVNMSTAINLQPVFQPGEVETADIIINEINYNSNDDWDTGDWIELHNRGTAAADLSGWVYRDDDDEHAFILPEGTIIQGGGYLVLARHLQDLLAFYPEMNNALGNVDFGLSSNGDMVRIYDAELNLVDSIAFLPGAPWPSEADGEGPTLELADPSLDNDLVENWAILHPHGSPGLSNLTPVTNLPILPGAGIDLAVAPNPFRDHVSISCDLPAAGELSFELYSPSGRLLRRINAGECLSGPQMITANLRELPSGLYLVRALLDRQLVGVDRWLKL
ncbi:MAG: CotH kinase family protein [Lewinella sp.]|nr:CotH kinase family protein [Lewinella sp.]